MKKIIYLLLGVLLITISLAFYTSCKDDNDETKDVILTEDEKSDLLTLREEEKLARDVYIYAYNKYGLNLFNNISSSEQTHMSRVLQIMNVYGLDDVASKTAGVFNNATLQEFYNSFTAKIDISLLDALIVGATIEDLDIKDIEDFKERTNKTDILVMYDNLVCGSRNHIRSYYAQIKSNSGSYTPQYISQEDFDTIIDGSMENCGQ